MNFINHQWQIEKGQKAVIILSTQVDKCICTTGPTHCLIGTPTCKKWITRRLKINKIKTEHGNCCKFTTPRPKNFPHFLSPKTHSTLCFNWRNSATFAHWFFEETFAKLPLKFQANTIEVSFSKFEIYWHDRKKTILSTYTCFSQLCHIF